MSFTRQTAIILQKVWVEAEGATNPQTIEFRYPAVLPSLTDTASNDTAYSNFVIIGCKLAYYVEILRRLGEAVCRQRPELWPIFGSPILTVFEVTERSVSSRLWRKAVQQSIAVLHTTLFSTADSATVAQQSIAVLHTTLFSRQCHCSTAIYRCTAHHIIQQTEPL